MTVAATGIGGLSKKDRAKAIIAGSAGNLIEWYDFYIYAFTALYFSSAFFPDGDRTTQLIKTSGIFAAGFLMRPLGAWFFGVYADRRGRRAAMISSIVLMGIGSALIAVLPTYAQVGALAPALLLLGRMVQGFSTGGQYGTAATYLSEISFQGRRGFYASFQYVTLIGGQLFALAVILILQSTIDATAMREYGWRVAFGIGAVAAIAILLTRNLIHETAVSGERHAQAGMIRGLVPHWRAFVTVIGLTAGGSLVFYVFTTYMQKYLVDTAGMDMKTANWVMTAVLIPFALLQMVFGAMSDRIGRRNNMLIFGVLATFCTWPLLALLGQVESAPVAFVLVLCGLTINAIYTSISGLFKAELFPVHVRALGVGLAYGIGNAAFGGSAEFVAFSFKQAGSANGFYIYVTAICAVSLLTAIMMPKMQGDSPLDDLDI
jgi:MFS family permease